MTSKTKKAEMSVIAGCFYGLAQLLTNFTHSVQEGTRVHHLCVTIDSTAAEY